MGLVTSCILLHLLVTAAAFSAKSSDSLNQCSLLILPGFGNASEDYLLPAFPEGSLVGSLVKRGWEEENITILPLKRTDWLQVLNGLFDPLFWKGEADPTRPAFRWYLDRVFSCLENAPTDRVVVLGHSAGGWLSRAALGFGSKPLGLVSINKVAGLVTLGTPHLPPPPGKVMDMTRGALRLTNENYPGSFHEDEGLFYVSVMGESVVGEEQKRSSLFEPTSAKGFAFASYKSVCGRGDVSGDGVVPLDAGHLPGATQITLCDVYHSVTYPSNWYGSDENLDGWHDLLVRALDGQCQDQASVGNGDT